MTAPHQRLSDHLREAAASLWERQHAHPFVRGIGDGTLDDGRFARWVQQDYAFLIDYCRVLSIGAARAPDLETLTAFVSLAHATATEEMRLHRQVAAGVGIDAATLDGVQALPPTRAYCDFLIRTASLADVAELAAALLPCMWGFSEIGQRLAAGGIPQPPQLRAWVASYADPAFAQQAEWCRGIVDRLGADAGPLVRARMERAFTISSEHELRFWDMAWDG